jgi:hypothetical protein
MKLKLGALISLGGAAAVTLIVLQYREIAQLRQKLAASRQETAMATGRGKEAGSAYEEPALDSGPKAFDWRALKASDYRQYIANLRAAGCPEQTIRDILIANVDRDYRPRIAKLNAEANSNNYWQRPDFAARPRAYAQMEQLRNEEREALRELLGANAGKDFDELRGVEPSHYDTTLGFLSQDKRDQLYELDRQYQQKRAVVELQQRAGQLTWEEQGVKHVELQKRKEDAIKSLLSPEELEEYKMRTSEHTYLLAVGRAAFEATEEEFRKIFKIEEQFGQNVQAGEKPNPKIEEPFQNALRQALGEQRYADYKLSQQPEYFRAYDVVQSFNLPKETVRTVYDINHDAYQAANTILNDQTLSSDARQSALNELRSKIEAANIQVLGEEAFNQYKYGGWFGTWLDRKMGK